jgi:acetyl-CoA carboxylase biotin carboxylase subunit
LAAGLGLSMRQDELQIRGHAIEVRVNAEDPLTFVPSPGRITGYHEPGGLGIRVDSAVHEQAMVQPYYDSLVAKLIARAPTRELAIQRLDWAIDEMVVEGIKTTLPTQKELLNGDAFRKVRYHTRYVDEWLRAKRDAR